MSFLYPLFLVAGVSLLIPLLIHLFNLRRYKTVLFPHTRFLKNLQLHSRKQSQLRYKWLLAARLLFLASLILAFAQPFFRGSRPKADQVRLHVIYLDNSLSMSAQNGQRSLLDIAKEKAAAVVSQSAGNFIILNNNKTITPVPVGREQALAAIYSTTLSPAARTGEQVLQQVQQLLLSNGTALANCYYISDFQRYAFARDMDTTLLRHLHFTGIPVQHPDLNNCYIDTAWFDLPVLQTGRSSKLIVRSRFTGKTAPKGIVIQLMVNGQLKSAFTPAFSDDKASTDTMNFQVNDAGWQRIVLAMNDAGMHYDDSFLVAARSTPDLSVLVLNEGQPNAYIQSALRAYSGFKAEQEPIGDATRKDFSAYNLILLNDVTRIDEALAGKLAEALQRGQSVCIFPAAEAQPAGLNPGLAKLGDIRLGGRDSSVQTVSALQPEHKLVKDMFEHLPDNVQLPVVKQHFILQAGLSANQQSIMSFRNGDPFFASYMPAAGTLYLCAAPANLQSGNFAASYFFVPFLYQMASLAKGGDIFAVTGGSKGVVSVSNRSGDARNMLHMRGNGFDVIPPQRAEGLNVTVFPGTVAEKTGFYTLSANGGSDTAEVAINADRRESQADYPDLKTLQAYWQNGQVNWVAPDATKLTAHAFSGSKFPLWKVCTILALLMLALETWLLADNLRKKNIITT